MVYIIIFIRIYGTKKVKDCIPIYYMPFLCKLFFHWTFHAIIHLFFKFICNLSMVYIHMFINVVMPLFLKLDNKIFLNNWSFSWKL
jgi:hypothetical protein